MSVIVFPGQGAQYKGMGVDLFDLFEKYIASADKILDYSIKKLCIDDPENCLRLTEFTQPALYTVNALHYFNSLNSSNKPNYTAGHSLGEYNALLAAGVFDFETGLRLVQKRGQLMSQAKGGAMLAVVRSTEQEVKSVLKNYQLERVDIANYNSPSQLVLSASESDIAEVKQIFSQEGIFCIPLKVSGAFHSRQMQSIAEEFSEFLGQFQFSEPKIPVIANVTARPYQTAQIKELLVRQIYSSVQWIDTIRYLMAKKDTDIAELGPGKVLTKLNQDIINNSTPLTLKANKNTISIASDLAINDGQLLGAESFRQDYAVKYSYAAGSMCNGIASTKLVIKMAKAKLLAFYGTTGLSLTDIEKAILDINEQLDFTSSYGMNLSYSAANLKKEQEMIELFLKHKVSCVEASGYQEVTTELVKYRLAGLKLDANNQVIRNNKILLKTAKIDVAELFMQPAPSHLVNKLLQEGQVSEEQARLAKQVALADDVCVEGDSGWRSSQTSSIVSLPEVISLRERLYNEQTIVHKVRVGTSGGIGTPEAVAATFTLGADFVLTGSINQCTIEAGISDEIKDLLQNIRSQDTCYAPYGELFESGDKVQIVRKGMFFPQRAQKLYDLYRLHKDIKELDPILRNQIEQNFFKKSFNSVYQEIIAEKIVGPELINKAEANPKFKMALIFRQYFENSVKSTLQGNKQEKDNYQVYCGPSLGAFNQWVKGSPLEKWKNRSVDVIAMKILQDAANLLNNRNIKAA